MSVLFLLSQLLIVVLLLCVIVLLLYSMVRGAPYAPIGKEKMKTMMHLLRIKKGEKAVDIGAGDGRIVIELAKQGALAYGYEINPILVLLAKWNIRKEGLSGKAHVHWGDMWKQNYATFDIITIYLTAHASNMLESKLRSELKPTGRIATNYYTFPHWKAEKTSNNIYLYKKG